MKDFRKKGWWLLFADGLLLVMAGIYMVVNPFDSYLMLVKYTGAVLLTGSVLHFIIALKLAQEKAETIWLLTESAFDLICGASMLFNPFMTFLGYPLFLAIWLAGSGGLKIFAGLFLQKTLRHSLPVISNGVLFILFAFVLLSGPYRSTAEIDILFGLFCIVTGGFFIVDAVYYRKSANIIDYLI